MKQNSGLGSWKTVDVAVLVHLRITTVSQPRQQILTNNLLLIEVNKQATDMKTGLNFCVCSFLHHLHTLKMKKISSIATLYLSVPDRSERSTTPQSGCRHSSPSLACVLCSRQKKLTQNSALPEAIALSEALSQ